MNESTRKYIKAMLLTFLLFVSSCSTPFRPWVEEAVVVGLTTSAPIIERTQLEALYSDYAVYVGTYTPLPVTGTGPRLDAQYAKSVNGYRSESHGMHVMFLRPGKYKFGGSDWVIHEFPTVEQKDGYTKIIESFMTDIGNDRGTPGDNYFLKPDVFLSISPNTTLIATKGYYKYDFEFEAGRFYAEGSSNQVGVDRIVELDKTAFFDEITGEPISYLWNCDESQSDRCIPVRASFEHRPSLCEKYKCLTKPAIKKRVDVARVVLNAPDRRKLIVSSGSGDWKVASRFDPRADLPYNLYIQRCFVHWTCR